jgi:hypothetical protein
MCALLLFAVLAVCRSVHAQSTGIYVNSNNNVGIGTTAPVEKLSLYSTAAAGYAKIGFSNDSTNFGVVGFGGNYLGQPTQTNDMVFRSDAGNMLFGFNGGEKMRVTTSGNVGIDTASPGAPLTVNGIIRGYNSSNGYGEINLENTTSGTYTGLQLRKEAGTLWGVKSVAPANDLALFTDNTVVNGVYIKSGGNVGIGTTSPQSKLHLSGGVNDRLLLDNGIILSQKNAAGGIVNLLTHYSNDYVYLDNPNGGIDIRTTEDDLDIKPGGNVGIGTTTPGYKLDVAGQVHASSFVSSTTTYADFVFKPGYKLEPLSAVEASIQKDGHLPGIPSEAEAKAHGIDLASMQVKLLQKIEELTLHQIEQQKLLENQTERLDDQSKRIEQLEQENTELRAQH